jgi:hypothetical protein
MPSASDTFLDEPKSASDAFLDSPVDLATPKDAHWQSLYGGLDMPPTDPLQQEAMDAMSRKLGPDKETRAQAINMTYVGSKLPGLSPQRLQDQWPNVRDAYAKEAGFTQGEPVTDTALYGHISKEVQDSAEKAQIAHQMATAGTVSARMGIVLHNFGHLFTMEAAKWWGEQNKPFAEIKRAPQMPDIPALGAANPAVAAGVWNTLAPALEGVETPVGAATLAVGGFAKAGIPVAQKTLGLITGFFSGLMAKSSAEATPEAVKILKDPESTTQQKVEAVGKPVVDAGMSILAGMHAISELAPNGGAVLKATEGKTPVEAAAVLREEANKLPIGDPATEAMKDTAAKLEEIPSPPTADELKAAEQPKAEKPAESAAPAAEPAADKPVTAAETIKEFSIKKAALDEEMAAQGDEPTVKGEKVSDKMAMETAAETLRKDPEAGAKLVDELSGPNPRAVSHNDVMLLQHEWTRLGLERDRAQEALDAATKAGDEQGIVTATDRVEITREDLANAAEVIRETTGGQGRAFRAIGLSLKEDYSLGAVEQRLREADPKTPITPEESSAVKDLTDQLKASEKKYEDYRRRASELLMDEKRAREPGRGKPPSTILNKLSEQADAARARLREKMASGRVSAGIDPTDLADMAIIVADHIAKGAKNLAEVTQRMVEEFGTKILPHVKAAYDKAMENKALESKLASKKKRLASDAAELKRRLAEDDLEPKAKRAAIPLDEEGVKLEAERNQLKEEIQKHVIRRKIAAMSFPEKAASKLLKWRRGFLLSSPSTLVKLTSAAAQRMAFTPLEELMGGLFSKMGAGDISAKAPREGGVSAKAEAEAITAAFTKGMSDAAAVFKTGKGVLDSAFGKKAGVVHVADVMPQTAIDFFGHLHGALKAPVKRAEFARSFAKRMAHAIENGADGTDPLIQTKVAVESYKDANRSIFMQDNMVTDAYKRALARFEQPDPETGKPTPSGQAWATFGRVVLPIVKVPTNIVAETAQYATGLGTGGVRAVLAMAKGVDKLTPDQADLIMRELKKGSIGGAALILGYMNPETFGGYYQPGEKRKETDAKALSIRAGGHDIPSLLLHSPLMETFQIGATVRRVAESKLHKHDSETQGVATGAWAAGLGLLEEVPFAREATELAKMFDPHERQYAEGELLKSILVPAVVQWLATHTDKDSAGNEIKRKPRSIRERVEMGVPGLREDVPADHGHQAPARTASTTKKLPTGKTVAVRTSKPRARVVTT